MMGRVMKYRNDLNTISFRGLTPVEIDFFWAIACLAREKGTDKLFFSREEITKLAGYDKSKKTIDDFIKTAKKMSKKLMKLDTELIDPKDGGCIMFVLFPFFKVTEEGIELKISEYFAPWFNLVTGDKWTRFEMESMIKLKSGYSKELLRFLMQFKSTGFMVWTTEELRKLLAIPKSYRVVDIDKRILNVAKKELLEKDELGNQILNSLTIKKIKGGYRNSQIVKYEFTFTVSKEKIISADSAEARQLDYEDKTRVKYGFSHSRKTLKGRIIRQEPIPDWYADHKAQSQAYQNKQAKRTGEVQDVNTLKQIFSYDQELAETTAKINKQRQELADRRARFEGFKVNLRYMPLGAIESVKKEFPEWAAELNIDSFSS